MTRIIWRRLRASHGVGAVRAGIRADLGDPSFDDSGVLPSRQMRGQPQPTWEQIILGLERRILG